MKTFEASTNRRLQVNNNRSLAYIGALAAMLVFACGDDKDEPEEKPLAAIGDECAPNSVEQQCQAELECDALLEGTGYVCGVPVELAGAVMDALNGAPIVGAQVVALSAEGSPVSEVATTGEGGEYLLQVSAARESDGEVATSTQWTLFASAQGYQVFPSGPRPAIPISATQISDTATPRIEASNTDVALLPLTDASAVHQLSGKIDTANPGGTLVVAEGVSTPAPYGIADSAGNFTLFNVPAGEFQLVGYKRGQALQRMSANTTAGSVSNIKLDAAESALSTVRGSVNIVNAPGENMTSVVLVPESVFDTSLERGPIPLGLRAPGLPERPSIQSAFEFDSVPAGKYIVLAAFENDNLVRDPDASIGGTSTQHIEVQNGAPIELDESFKITEHLAIIGPGADAPETVSGDVIFRWADDSSEDRYEIELYTALGELVWEDRAVPSVSGGTEVSRTYDGAALTTGMVYQFRVTSFRDKQAMPTPISRSEDLRGVFTYGE